jgi:hypothetical protein
VDPLVPFDFRDCPFTFGAGFIDCGFQVAIFLPSRFLDSIVQPMNGDDMMLLQTLKLGKEAITLGAADEALGVTIPQEKRGFVHIQAFVTHRRSASPSLSRVISRLYLASSADILSLRYSASDALKPASITRPTAARYA